MSYQIQVSTLTEMLWNGYEFPVSGGGGEVIPISWRISTWQSLLFLSFPLGFSPTLLSSSFSSFPLYSSLCLLLLLHLPPPFSPLLLLAFFFVLKGLAGCWIRHWGLGAWLPSDAWKANALASQYLKQSNSKTGYIYTLWIQSSQSTVSGLFALGPVAGQYIMVGMHSQGNCFPPGSGEAKREARLPFCKPFIIL